MGENAWHIPATYPCGLPNEGMGCLRGCSNLIDAASVRPNLSDARFFAWHKLFL